MNSKFENDTPNNTFLDRLIQANGQAMETREQVPYQPVVYAIPEEWRLAEKELLEQAVKFQPELYRQIRQLATRQQVEFMQEHVGQEFDGVISGVTDWGVYVELTESKCEGMIPIRELEPADYYDFIEKEYCVKGERTGTVYTLGDQVRVRVTRADLARKQLDFELVL